VAVHRFGGAHRHLGGAFAEEFAQAGDFDGVAFDGGGAVGIHVIHVVRAEPGVVEGMRIART
jgi:hypothetical protein